MTALLSLLQPVIQAILNFSWEVGKELAPEVKGYVEKYITSLFAIIVAYATLDLSSDEAKASFMILVDTIEADGATLLGQLEIKSEQLPKTIVDALSGVIGSLPGQLLKLAGI